VLPEQPSLTCNSISLFSQESKKTIQIYIQHPGKILKYINPSQTLVREEKHEFVTSSACANEHRIFGPVNTGSRLILTRNQLNLLQAK
jgi:hypothetical protein